MAEMNGFDADKHETPSFETVKPGWYTCVATESDIKETKKGDGDYYEFVLEIQDGPFKGKKVWARLTRTNPNSAAEEIGASQLAAFCQAVGVPRPKRTEELHYKAVEVKIANRKYNEETYEDVKGFRAVAGTSKRDAPSDERSETTKSKPW